MITIRLLWAALLGRPIIHRVTLYGPLRFGREANTLIARCRFVTDEDA